MSTGAKLHVRAGETADGPVPMVITLPLTSAAGTARKEG